MDRIEIDGSHKFLRTQSPDNCATNRTGGVMEQQVRHAAQARALSARNRTGEFKEPSGVLHMPQIPHPKRFSLWELLKGESVVETRTTDGGPATIRIPHTLVGTLVVIAFALISCGTWIVGSVSRIETKQDAAAQRDARTDIYMQTTQAYVIAETNTVRFVAGMLTRDQQKALAEYQKANPMPPLPDPKIISEPE